MFNARLAKIEDYCDPVTNRVKEMKARPAAVAGQFLKNLDLLYHYVLMIIRLTRMSRQLRDVTR